jgi:hypothetical protein
VLGAYEEVQDIRVYCIWHHKCKLKDVRCASECDLLRSKESLIKILERVQRRGNRVKD